MCLSADQIEAIKQETAHFFGADARAWLSGLRMTRPEAAPSVWRGTSNKLRCVRP